MKINITHRIKVDEEFSFYPLINIALLTTYNEILKKITNQEYIKLVRKQIFECEFNLQNFRQELMAKFPQEMKNNDAYYVGYLDKTLYFYKIEGALPNKFVIDISNFEDDIILQVEKHSYETIRTRDNLIFAINNNLSKNVIESLFKENEEASINFYTSNFILLEMLTNKCVVFSDYSWKINFVNGEIIFKKE